MRNVWSMAEHTFGSYLAKERKRAGHTIRRLAKKAGKSSSTISRWENDQFVPARDDALGLDKALELRGALFRKWEGFTAESTLLPWMQDAGKLEEAASLIEYVSPVLVPGLLQSPSYAEIVFREGQPLLPAYEVQRLAALRCARYEQLRAQNDPWVSAVFPVSALLCVPEAVRAEQVSHLLSLEKVSLHLVPEGSALIGVITPMLMVRLLEGGKAASADHLTGNVVYGETDDFDRLTELVKRAFAIALPEPQSRKLLEELP